MSVTVTCREKVIFYGYVFGLCPDDYPDTEAAAHAIITEAGIPYPYDETGNTLAWAHGDQAAIDAYWNALNAAENGLPVGQGTHGTDAVPTPFLCIPGTRRGTPRGTERAVPHLPPIPLTGRAVDPQWQATLDTFLATQGITAPTGTNQPGWWSAAYEDRD
jgi:hypothetical protein